MNCVKERKNMLYEYLYGMVNPPDVDKVQLFPKE